MGIGREGETVGGALILSTLNGSGPARWGGGGGAFASAARRGVGALGG